MMAWPHRQLLVIHHAEAGSESARSLALLGSLADGVPVGYLPASCNATGRGPFTPPRSCMQALSHFRGFLTYQPASRNWAFQGIETGISSCSRPPWWP